VVQRATRQDQAAFTPPPHSLAVLPFASSPGDAAAADLSDGLAEQLISELGRVGQLHIVAPQSSLMFRNTTSPLLEIAKRLDVGAILAGSIRRFGGTLNITIQLSDPRTGFEIWSGAYDRPGDDVPALRNDIARHVTQALGLVAPQAPEGFAATGGSRSPAAWEALFAAVPLIGTGKMQEYQQARSLLTKAITLDPKFAEAYRYRATVEVAMEDVAASASGENQDDFIRAAITDGQTAVALAPQSGPAHGALAAALLSSNRNPRGAATEYQRALLLSPSDGELYARAAQVMLELGMRDIAVAYARRGEALDPLSALTVGNAASVFAHAHLADDTHAALRHLHELAPNTGWTNDRTCVSLMVLGEFAGAQAVCDQEPAWVKASTDAIGYWKRGDKAKAASALRDLQALGRDDFAVQFAEIYTTWGDLKNGRYWLSEATRLHDSGLSMLLVDVFLAPLRDTPEFDAAARSVGLR